MGKQASLVLSDELLSQFYAFKENGKYDQRLVEKLLHYYKPVYLTNIAQLDRIGHQPDTTLRVNLIKSKLVKQSLEELVRETRFKVILCTDRDDFPFINIHGDKVENNYSGTFLRSESRAKAMAHIEALCADAEAEIIVYDKYFNSSNRETERQNVEVLKKILPKRKLKIRFARDSFSAYQQGELRAACTSWNLSEELLSDNHDRYLIIDNKMEIVLTSGFQYLTDDRKDFTYLVRKIDSHQFL